MRINRKNKIVYFLLNTGSPKTYLCEEVFNEFGIFPNPHNPTTASINGKVDTVSLSPTHFSGLNILGLRLMGQYHGDLRVCYDKKTFSLKFKFGQEESDQED